MVDDVVIDIAGLSKGYRRVEAVRGVSFAVYPGEVFGLLGPDGAGKSTIIQVLAGVLLPSRGAASVAGIDVLRDPEGVKARIGYMPQGLGLNLYDDLTVDDHLQFFAELRGVPVDQFRDHRATLLDITRLTPAADRLARHLSGGMRQKLGLACALIHLPDVLLLDEPTTGVDPLSRQDFWHIINRFSRKRQITVLLATPYLDEAERCHRVALMNRGRLLALGSPDELKAGLAGEGREGGGLGGLPGGRRGRRRPGGSPRSGGTGGSPAQPQRSGDRRRSPDQTLWQYDGGERNHLHGGHGRDLWVPGSQRRRKDHGDQDAGGDSAADARPRAGRRLRHPPASRRHQAHHRLHVA